MRSRHWGPVCSASPRGLRFAEARSGGAGSGGAGSRFRTVCECVSVSADPPSHQPTEIPPQREGADPPSPPQEPIYPHLARHKTHSRMAQHPPPREPTEIQMKSVARSTSPERETKSSVSMALHAYLPPDSWRTSSVGTGVGTSLIRNCFLLGPCSRPMTGALWWS